MKEMIQKVLALSHCLLAILLPTLLHAQSAQSDTRSMINYRETPERINDLVHTKLSVVIDFKNRQLHGREWLTVKPHFYATDSLRLDAKGMDIHSVSILKNGKPAALTFVYDSLQIAIRLDKLYHCNETYTLYIEYTAKPEELKGRKNNEKGLYFINHDGKDKNKPIQLWTEGETENSSVWFPTIDKPNQKTTAEISITAPSQFVTLSNGRLAHQQSNAGGTRTDTWKMDLPHSPYLFMMAVGNFKIYKEKWRNKEVSYYLEPRYAPYAKDIFGETPEAMEFFSQILGLAYPWHKYAQVVVRDYISGAMENTSATVFGEAMQGMPKELADRYNNTGIVHELFHQWFGDYVTAESWSNLCLNESLAVLGEMLWLEHKYGKDAALAHHLDGIKAYMRDKNAWTKNLVRFEYNDRQEVFDGVTYQKGGSILYMLRNYLGETAFNKGLNIYLVQNAFKPAEAHQLRLAFEEASGKDLNWFFNQWFFGAGHPDLQIAYAWDPATLMQTVYLQQKQPGKTFMLPLTIDIYIAGKKERHELWTNKKFDTLFFRVPSKPDLVNVDAAKTLVINKTDLKTPDQLSFQYFHGPVYADRLEAVEAAISNQPDEQSKRILVAALKDKFYKLRIRAIQALEQSNNETFRQSADNFRQLAVYDDNNLVKAAAIHALGTLKISEDLELIKKSFNLPSYAVQAASLRALANIDSSSALLFARQFEHESNSTLFNLVLDIYTTYGGDEQWPYIYQLFDSLRPPKKNNIIEQFARFTARVQNTTYARQGIDAIKELGFMAKQYGLGATYINILGEIGAKRAQRGDKASALKADEAKKEIANK